MIAPTPSTKWRMVTLDDVAAPVKNAIVDGPFGSNLKLGDYVSEGVPVLQGKNITDDTFRWFDVRFISSTKAEELKRSSVRTGDILIVKIGSIGYSAVLDDLNGYDHAIIPANLAKVTPNLSKVDLRYLHRWLTSTAANDYLVRVASKTAQPALSLRKIKDLPVPLPPLAEQKRIARILDAADALRAKRREALAQLDTLLQSTFLDMFGDPVTNPMGWEASALSEVTDEIYRYPSYFGIVYENEGVPEIRGELIGKGGKIITNPSELRFIAQTTSDKFPRTQLAAGDLVMSVRGTIGKIGIVPAELTNANMTANLIRISPTRSIVEPVFLLHIAFDPYFINKLSAASSSTTIKTIKALDLKAIPIPLPPLKLQRSFAKIVESIEHQKARQQAHLTELDTLFASLQSRAFRGDL